MSGGLLVDATALHSFLFISRERPGLSAPLPAELQKNLSWQGPLLDYVNMSRRPDSLPPVSGFEHMWDTDVPKPVWLQKSGGGDVLCAVKRFVSDKDWAQPPVVVLPEGGLTRLLTYLLDKQVSRVWAPKHSEQWRKAALVVQRFVDTNPTYLRATTYLHSLADGVCGAGTVPPELPWHAAPPEARSQPFHLPTGL